MAITCPHCGAQFDVTLFQFGKTVRCDCGRIVRLEEGHTTRIDGTGPRHSPRPPDPEPPIGNPGTQQTE